MSGDQVESNYPRANSVQDPRINLNILNGAVKFGLPLAICYTLLTFLGVANEFNWLSRDLGFGIVVAKVLVLGLLGFLVCHWFVEGYSAICELRNLPRKFVAKKIISSCSNPFIGFLPLMFFADWIFAWSVSPDARTMSWKRPWSNHSEVNVFGSVLALHFGLALITYILPFATARPAFLLLPIMVNLLFAFVVWVGYWLGKRMTAQLIDLAVQTSRLN